MADAAPKAPSIQDRQKAVVATLQTALVAMPRFRPADVALAQEYDAMMSGILQAVIDLSAVAAVDRHATALAIELTKQRKDYGDSLKKQNDDADAAAQAMSATIAQTLLPKQRQSAPV